MPTTTPQLLPLSKLSGSKVLNLEGEDLGKVEELVVDISNDRIAYAVLSFGGFLGIGDKHFAIPWESLRVDKDKECFVLDVPRERLEEAPGFDKDNWPDMSDLGWSNEVHDYYGVRPYWTAV